jgi:hypothetical protein
VARPPQDEEEATAVSQDDRASVASVATADELVTFTEYTAEKRARCAQEALAIMSTILRSPPAPTPALLPKKGAVSKEELLKAESRKRRAQAVRAKAEASRARSAGLACCRLKRGVWDSYSCAAIGGFLLLVTAVVLLFDFLKRQGIDILGGPRIVDRA